MVTLDTAGRSMGTLRIVLPPPDLEPLVEHVSIERREDDRRDPPSRYRIVPDGSGHLIVHLFREGRREPRVRVVGARSVAIDVDKSRRSCTIALRLRPGALGTLLRSEGRELLDRSLPVGVALGAEGLRLEQRIADAPDVHAVVEALLNGVRRRAGNRRPDWRLAAAAEVLDAAEGRSGIDTVCDRTGIAGRTLREVVGRELGFGPKRLARIRRIYGLIRRGMRDPRARGAELAADAGFADQAHMIRESRSLLGETPREFLSRGIGARSRRFVQDPTVADR